MTRSIARARDALVSRIEQAAVLDKPSAAVAALLGRLFRPGPVRDAASGTHLGHPLHPALVALPLGSWAAATILDLTRADAKAAQRLVGLGVLTALPTAAAGANDWLTTSGGERRVGLVHASLNSAALGLYVGSWLTRHQDRRATGMVLALAGAGTAAISGWLGGHLAYAAGVGVDTTAFQHFPPDWTDVAAVSDVRDGAATLVEVGAVAVLLAWHDGQVVALAARCTHRGGPLHEGEIADGCVTCPWHGSRFALADGAVVGGPATRPQPVADVRVVNGRVELRRGAEPRTLRTMPVGP